MDNRRSANPHHMVFQAFRQDVADAGWPSLLKHIPTYRPRPAMDKEGSKHGINSVSLFNRAHIFMGIHRRSRYEPISHVYALVESERAKVYYLRPSSELNKKPWLKVPAEDRLVHAGAMWSMSWEKVELLPQFEQLEAHKQNPENLRGALLALLQYYLLQWVSRPKHGDSKKYRTPAIHELVSAAKSLAAHKGIVLGGIPRAPAYDGYSRQLSEIRRQMGASETKKRKRNEDDTSAYAARAPTATADSSTQTAAMKMAEASTRACRPAPAPTLAPPTAFPVLDRSQPSSRICSSPTLAARLQPVIAPLVQAKHPRAADARRAMEISEALRRKVQDMAVYTTQKARANSRAERLLQEGDAEALRREVEVQRGLSERMLKDLEVMGKLVAEKEGVDKRVLKALGEK